MRRFDFMGRKYWWFAFSGAVILAGLVSLLVPLARGNGIGLNLSIDFTSGSRLTMDFSKPTSIDKVRSVVAGAGYPDAVVQTVGGDYQVTLPALSNDQQNALTNKLSDAFGKVNLKQSEVIGPTFGRQIVNSMIEAIIAAWVLLIIYVSIRFEYKSAVATLVALVHDLLVTVGVYSITGREVTTATVAAVLTILGYSLYDTIIVFDRIRENAPLAKRGGYGAMVNQSIWEVMNRSIITSLLTLMPVICLLLFGGTTLKDFAFALLVGISSGAYSSIFVAAPLLTLWKEREKRYRPGQSRSARKARSAKAQA